jgi:hypothetical protein
LRSKIPEFPLRNCRIFTLEKPRRRIRHIAEMKPFFKKGASQTMENRERQNRITLRLSDDELYILEQKFKSSNMKDKSAFLRHLIIYGYVYDVDYSELREYNSVLAKIGNNLNQIAKRMNATGNVYEADVKEVKELMNKVWHTQKSMLSRQPSIKQ